MPATLTDDEIDAIDDLPTSHRPALCFVQAQLIAAHATRRGLDERDAGRAEKALAQFALIVDQMGPSALDVSPNGWTRAGARDGAFAGWTVKPGEVPQYVAPACSLPDAELYFSAWGLTCAAVIRVVREGGR